MVPEKCGTSVLWGAPADLDGRRRLEPVPARAKQWTGAGGAARTLPAGGGHRGEEGAVMSQVALVTDCSTGIGQAVAEHLTAAGYTVVATA